MKSNSELYQRGMSLGVHLGGESFHGTVSMLESVDHELAGYLVEDAYGKVLSRGGPTWSAFLNERSDVEPNGRSVDSLPPRRALLVLPARPRGPPWRERVDARERVA